MSDLATNIQNIPSQESSTKDNVQILNNKASPRKYNYTKKTGRPKRIITIKDLPSNWKEMVYDMASKGMSDVEIRAAFCMSGKRVNVEMFYVLKEKDVEFSETIKNSRILCEAWWLTAARKALRAKQFQAAVWYMNMKNRFGWRDKQEVEHSGNINVGLQTLIENVNRAAKENHRALERVSVN